MSTRYLIAALLMTSACVAHADVTTSTPVSSGFLSTWTTGNGADVAGTLSNNASLIGGVAHGADASVTQALYQQASANAAQTNGVVKISYSQGIQGDFLTRTSNAMLVAMLGDNLSAVTSPDGAIISTASKSSSNMAPSGGVPVSSGGGKTNVNTGGTTNAGGNSNLNTGGNGNLNAGGTTNAGDSGLDGSLQAGNDTPAGTPTKSQPLSNDPLAQGDAANVPEPSSIALLAAGLFGAVGLRRRAKR